jgi:glycosyltransferase involved in cell wall biosynthesis
MLSGWGIGWTELNELQARERLGNVTLLPPVRHEDLIEFLSSADIWIIPYRRNIAGVSIPSRLYNLLAIGRAIIVAAEPNAEAALVISEEEIGSIVPPEEPAALAEAIALAAQDRAGITEKGRRAAAAAAKYSPEVALARYREVILQAGSRDSGS